MPSAPNFIHLRVHTAYSLAGSSIKPKDLVKSCKAMGMPAVGISDTDNLVGALSVTSECLEAGIQPVIGVDMRARFPDGGVGVVCLKARTSAGFRELMRAVGEARLAAGDGEVPVLSPEDLASIADGVILLTGGPKGPIDTASDDDARARLVWLKEIFGDNVYLELQRPTHDTGSVDQGVLRREPGLVKLADELGIPLVATNSPYFLKPEMHRATEVLRCIGAGVTLLDRDRDRLAHGQYLKSPQDMEALFADLPDALANTVEIARRCSGVALKDKPRLPSFPGLPDGVTEADHLYKMAHDGLTQRIALRGMTKGWTEQQYRERLDFELNTIKGMGFPGYFLIVADFIQWAKNQGIAVGPGRGSGAGSLVAYALKITDLDPIRYGLLFERFLNPERVSMPDFDIDFEQDRRLVVVDYVKQRYGHDRVAQIGTIGKLKAKAAIRDAGRVLSMPFGLVDRIAKMIPDNPSNPVDLATAKELEPLKSALEEAASEGDRDTLELVKTAEQIEGLYRGMSTHAAGVVIGQGPIKLEAPLFRDQHGQVVTQWDMKSAENAGLVKFDFLGLKTLDVILQTQSMLQRRGIKLDFLFDHAGEEGYINPFDVIEDKKTYEMIARGETYGVFQLESAGMRQAIMQVEPTDIDDLIALVSLYRPGPMAYIPDYAAVKKGLRKASYYIPGEPDFVAQEKMAAILDATFGVMVYQEQVMQLAQSLAGYSLGGADLLRRAMGKKIPEEMAKQQAIFVDGCRERGIPEKNAMAIFDKIMRFASYGFNKSHAAAYALVSFETAYLRCHHPAEFIAANVHIERRSTEKVAAFLSEGARMGLRINPPDVNQSGAFVQVAVPEGDPSLPAGCRGVLQYGLATLKGVGDDAARAIENERLKNGPFKSPGDFMMRIARDEESARLVNKGCIVALIEAGALDSLEPNRAKLLDEKNFDLLHGWAQRSMKKERADRAKGQASMFDLLGGMNTDDVRVRTKKKDSLDADMVQGLRDVPPLSDEQKLRMEYAVLGLFVRGHPVDPYVEILKRVNAVTIADLLSGHTLGGPARLTGALITGLVQKQTKKGDTLLIIHLSDTSGASAEVTVFGQKEIAKVLPVLKEGEPFALRIRAWKPKPKNPEPADQATAPVSTDDDEAPAEEQAPQQDVEIRLSLVGAEPLKEFAARAQVDLDHIADLERQAADAPTPAAAASLRKQAGQIRDRLLAPPGVQQGAGRPAQSQGGRLLENSQPRPQPRPQAARAPAARTPSAISQQMDYSGIRIGRTGNTKTTGGHGPKSTIEAMRKLSGPMKVTTGKGSAAEPEEWDVEVPF